MSYQRRPEDNTGQNFPYNGRLPDLAADPPEETGHQNDGDDLGQQQCQWMVQIICNTGKELFPTIVIGSGMTEMPRIFQNLSFGGNPIHQRAGTTNGYNVKKGVFQGFHAGMV